MSKHKSNKQLTDLDRLQIEVFFESGIFSCRNCTTTWQRSFRNQKRDFTIRFLAGRIQKKVRSLSSLSGLHNALYVPHSKESLYLLVLPSLFRCGYCLSQLQSI
jgi:hypothetical protein